MIYCCFFNDFNKKLSESTRMDIRNIGKIDLLINELLSECVNLIKKLNRNVLINKNFFFYYFLV